MSRRGLLFALALAAALAGCNDPRSYVRVVLDGPQTSVDHVVVKVRQGGADAAPLNVPVPGGTVRNFDFALAFDADRKGSVTVTVDAIDAGGRTIGHGEGTTTLMPGGGPVVLNISLGDSGDMRMDDLATPDLFGADLYGVDLVMPDLAMPDLAMPDLVMPDGAVSVPMFAAPKTRATSAYGVAKLAAGDFDSDGDVDAVATGDTSTGNPGTTVYVYGNDKTGAFPGLTTLPAGSATQHMLVTDLDGTGTPELVLSTLNGIVIFESGKIQPSNTITGTCASVSKIAAGDFNGDGARDLAQTCLTTNRVTPYYQAAGGGFAFIADTAISAITQPTFVATVPASSMLDGVLITGQTTQNHVVAYDVFGSTIVPYPVLNAVPIHVATGDLNGDGLRDAVVTYDTTGKARVLLALGGSGFKTVGDVTIPNGATRMVASVIADFNRDGTADLATLTAGTGNVEILRGLGNGGFVPAATLLTDVGATDFTTADLNNDGKPDILVLSGKPMLYAFLNQTP